MGNLKKLEKVWASNTSLADTAINKPNRAEVNAIKKTAMITRGQYVPLKSAKFAAKATGTKAFTIPKIIAPDNLAKTSVLILIGARSNLSKERDLFSKVIVTASIEVVPNRMLIAIKPGSNSIISTFPGERTSCISVQDSGKIMPQLIFGGFK
jgi:hypothetical protein